MRTRPVLWRTARKEVTEEQYKEFYRQTTLEFEEPLQHTHMITDAPVQLYALLFIPAKAERGMMALRKEDGAAFGRTGEQISAAERRAMEAERETIDRYVAAYLSERVGDVMATRITGVQPFGFFAQIEGLGGDGLVPAATLGDEYFVWDEAGQALVGERSGTRYESGQRLELRLVEANPLTGSLAFALPDSDPSSARRGPQGRSRRSKPGGQSAGRGPRGRPTMGKRGRPANIRHQSR